MTRDGRPTPPRDPGSGSGSSSDPAPSPGRRTAVGSRRVLIIASACVVVVAAGAFVVGTAVSKPSAKATITDSALNLPTISGLPRYSSASPRPSASASPKPSTTKSAPKGTAATESAVVAEPTTQAAPADGPTAAPTTQGPAVPVNPASSAGSPVPVGDWQLNQTTGNTAVDSTGAHNGTATDGWFAGTAFLLNGSNSQVYTDGPVLSTGSGDSFTVSAWVYLAAYPVAPSYDSTAVSEDTSTDSSFYLQFSYPSGRWAFSRAAENSTGSSAAYRATSTAVPALNTWTHLVGVFDGSNGAMSIYVNGQAQGTATDPSPFAGTGDLVIGRGQYHGSSADWWDGAIKEVEVFGSALTPSQVDALS